MEQLTQQLYARGVAIENLQKTGKNLEFELRQTIREQAHEIAALSECSAYANAAIADLEQKLNAAYQTAEAVAQGMAIEADELESRTSRLHMRIKALGFDPAMPTR